MDGGSLITTEGTFHVFWERVMSTPDSQPRNTTRFLCVCISNILLPRQGYVIHLRTNVFELVVTSMAAPENSRFPAQGRILAAVLGGPKSVMPLDCARPWR
jgi:hypothetical protein